MAKLVNIAFYVYYMYQVLPKNLCNHKRMLSIVMQIVNRSLFLGILFNHFCCFLSHAYMFKLINISHNVFDKWFWMGSNFHEKCLLIWFLLSLFFSCLAIFVLSVTTSWRETVSFISLVHIIDIYWFTLSKFNIYFEWVNSIFIDSRVNDLWYQKY